MPGSTGSPRSAFASPNSSSSSADRSACPTQPRTRSSPPNAAASPRGCRQGTRRSGCASAPNSWRVRSGRRSSRPGGPRSATPRSPSRRRGGTPCSHHSTGCRCCTGTATSSRSRPAHGGSPRPPGFPNQAFALGDALLGLQFHLEGDHTQIERWLIGHAHELASAGIDPVAVREDAARHGPRLADAARLVFDAWIDTALPAD